VKIHPVGADLFHVEEGMDGWTDIMKLIINFCNSANVPKNIS